MKIDTEIRGPAMSNEILILCNSAACLNEISSGLWPDLSQRNIFTCNLAYTFFRTEGRHLNIFSDAEPIKAFFEEKNWSAVYAPWRYNKVEFVFSKWEMETKAIFPNEHQNCPLLPVFSPVSVPGSSAINALLYLNACENFDKIYLLGYTINEWEGISHVKELQGKKQALEALLTNYKPEMIRANVWRYEKR